MVEKIKTLANLYDVLKQVPRETLEKYGVGQGEDSFGLITMFEDDEDSFSESFQARWDDEVTTCPAMQEVVNYFNAIFTEFEDGELEGDDFVSS